MWGVDSEVLRMKIRRIEEEGTDRITEGKEKLQGIRWKKALEELSRVQ